MCGEFSFILLSPLYQSSTTEHICSVDRRWFWWLVRNSSAKVQLEKNDQEKERNDKVSWEDIWKILISKELVIVPNTLTLQIVERKVFTEEKSSTQNDISLFCIQYARKLAGGWCILDTLNNYTKKKLRNIVWDVK